jgi:hypothetical protein
MDVNAQLDLIARGFRPDPVFDGLWCNSETGETLWLIHGEVVYVPQKKAA